VTLNSNNGSQQVNPKYRDKKLGTDLGICPRFPFPAFDVRYSVSLNMPLLTELLKYFLDLVLQICRTHGAGLVFWRFSLFRHSMLGVQYSMFGVFLPTRSAGLQPGALQAARN
jgi:hypothetical protein